MHFYRSISFVTSAAILGVTLLVSGCSLLDLHDDLREMEKFVTLSGRVIETETTPGQVVLAIIKDELRRDHLFEARIIDPEMLQIKLPSGRYFLFAYKDENSDFQYQAEEPAGFFGDPTPITLQDGDKQAGLGISLERNLALPTHAVGSTNEQAPDASDFPHLWTGRKNVGALITLDDQRFEPEIASLGLWQPVRFTLDPGHGLRTGFSQIPVATRSGHGIADASEGVGGKPGAIWLPAAACPSSAGWLAGKPQADLPALLRRRSVDPDPKSEAPASVPLPVGAIRGQW